MNIDNNNRASTVEQIENMNNIQDTELAELYNDTITLDNIMSGNSGVFFTSIPTFFFESLIEIQNAITLFDNNKVTGGYGSLKAGSEILLMILFIFAEGDEEKQKSRIEQWKSPENDFGKMIKEINLWKNYSVVINSFPSYKKNISSCNNRMNKMRHKHSIRYFESANRWNWEEKWQEQRKNDFKNDIKFVMSHLLLTWLIIDPILLIVHTEEFHNRYPDAISQFPNNNFIAKYLPEAEPDDFVANFPLTKDTYNAIKKMYKYSQEQSDLREFGFLTETISISDSQRTHFNENDLLIYDLFKSGKVYQYENIIIFGEHKFYKMPKGNNINEWGMPLWADDDEELGEWWETEFPGKRLPFNKRYEMDTIIFMERKVLLLKPIENI